MRMVLSPTSRRGPKSPPSAAMLLWPLVLLGTAVSPSMAVSQGIATAPPALGMAVPLPDPGMANDSPSALPAPVGADAGQPHVEERFGVGVPGRRRPRGLGSGFADARGRLPNQRTGPRHEHVVHEICIGC